jgi:predicted O-methyltransferase YrrM
MKKKFKNILRLGLPYGFFLRREKLIRKKKSIEHQKRVSRLNLNTQQILDYDYEISIKLLIEKGLDEQQIREGSIPENSLEYLFFKIGDRLNELPSVKVLHIGNFLGISLIYISNALLKLNPNSTIISIDPDIPHRGVKSPNRYVQYLLNRFGLQKNNIVFTGYTLEKNLCDDGGVYYYSEADVDEQDYYSFYASDILSKMLNLNLEFDLIIIDGNHERSYLEREIKIVDQLLNRGGILVFDDVNENWEDVKVVFNNILLQPGFRLYARDKRIGLIEKIN